MTSKKKRQRGSKTHSSGSMKNRRGAGHKGGHGDAGSGKRGDAVKPSYWKDADAKGFTSLQQKMGKGDAINLSAINEQLDTLKEEGVAFEEDGELVVDLAALGYSKVLGSGEARDYTLIVDDASGSAEDKLDDEGGALREPGQ